MEENIKEYTSRNSQRSVKRGGGNTVSLLYGAGDNVRTRMPPSRAFDDSRGGKKTKKKVQRLKGIRRAFFNSLTQNVGNLFVNESAHISRSEHLFWSNVAKTESVSTHLEPN